MRALFIISPRVVIFHGPAYNSPAGPVLLETPVFSGSPLAAQRWTDFRKRVVEHVRARIEQTHVTHGRTFA